MARQAAARFSSIYEGPDWPDYEFAFHDQEEIGPRMMARIAKRRAKAGGSV